MDWVPSTRCHLRWAVSGWIPFTTLGVCSDAARQKLLTQRSENIGQNTESLSGRRRWPESSEHLANPDVESKVRQLPERCYVTAPMGRWLDDCPPPAGKCAPALGSCIPPQKGHFIC